MQPRSDTALLIVDMINLFDFEGGRPLAEAAAAIAPRIARLRQRFHDAGAPTLYVNDNFANWRGEFRDLLGACLEAEGPPSEIVRHLAPRAHDYYVLKPKHSGFLGTPLAILLAKLGMPRLVLAGLSTDSCILATAQGANMREYDLWVPSDCVAAISPERSTRALKLMAASMHVRTRASRATKGLFPD